MKKILIIEDDQSLYNVYAAELKLRGYDVAHEADGMRAVATIEDYKPDLILLDIILPGRNGLEILEEIQGQKDLAGIKVLMVTNYGNDSNVKKALELGAFDYVLKYNVVPSDLSEKVAQALGEDSDSTVKLTN